MTLAYANCHCGFRVSEQMKKAWSGVLPQRSEATHIHALVLHESSHQLRELSFMVSFSGCAYGECMFLVGVGR